MAIRLSAYFQIPAKDLERFGVLNAYLGIDNLLFVDPILLKSTKVPELKDAREDLDVYFGKVIKLLKASKAVGDVAWKSAVQRMTFKEEHGAALGYAGAGGSGRGIGPAMAEMLVRRGSEIVSLDIEAPEMFELIGLFQEDFGPDLLSDMAVGILKDRFLAYTQRVAQDLVLRPSRLFPYREGQWFLPVHPDGKRALLFVPSDVLVPLPLALDRSEIWLVAQFNAEIRRRWNEIVAAASKDRKNPSKAQIREMLLAKPKNIADLIDIYRRASGKGYDFNTDPAGILSWADIGRLAAEHNPLTIKTKKPRNIEQLREVLNHIVRQFKKNIEQNKLYEVLYDDSGKPRREVFAQLVFFASADAYCAANDVDLSREPNAGNGPVDFKLSTGYRTRILVEIKKSSNPSLLHGFAIQLDAYQKSEATEESLFLILRVSDNESAINDVLALRERQKATGAKVPDIIVIDARKMPSALNVEQIYGSSRLGIGVGGRKETKSAKLMANANRSRERDRRCQGADITPRRRQCTRFARHRRKRQRFSLFRKGSGFGSRLPVHNNGYLSGGRIEVAEYTESGTSVYICGRARTLQGCANNIAVAAGVVG